MVWFYTLFWGLAALSVVLGVLISAEEYITEKIHGSDSKGDH